MARALTTIKSSNALFTEEDLITLIRYPHIIGHLAGYDKLTDIHTEMIQYAYGMEGPKVKALWGHRQSYKTSGVTCIGAVWRMLIDPEVKIMIIRKTFTEAAETVADIAKIMKIPEIVSLFEFAHGFAPKATREVIGNGLVTYNFKTRPSIAPSVLGMGSNSAFTGKHASCVIFDDLSTIQDRISKAEREHSKMVYREAISAILDKGPDNRACYLGTPWARDGVESLIPEPRKYDVYSTGIISSEELEVIRKETTPALFALNYELRYTSEAGMFSDPQYGEWLTDNVEMCRGQIDMAYGGGKSGDFTALTIGARRSDGKIQMVGFMFKGNGPDWYDRMADILRMYKCRTLAIENNSDKGFTCKEMRNRGFAVKDYNEQTNKQNRIATYLWEVWPNTVWANETDEEYMLQIVEWQPETKDHDDAPDSAASLARAFYSKKASMTARWEW